MVVVMASYDPTSTEMNPMYATVQDHPTSQSSLPSVASNRDTATSETALLNQYDQPQKEAKTRSGHPSRLDTENTIYGKGLAEEKEKKVAHFAAEEYSSRDRLWTYTRSCAFLVLPVLACIFAAAVLIVTLLVAFGVLQLAAREQPAAEQVGGAPNWARWATRVHFVFGTSSLSSYTAFVTPAVCVVLVV